MTNYLPEWHIYEAADYIGHWLQTYARVNVTQYKEKYGEARVYCTLGWTTIGHIIQPGWYRYRFDSQMYRNLAEVELPKWLQDLSFTVHCKLYRWRYRQAVEKWPDYRGAILDGADHEELLEGL